MNQHLILSLIVVLLSLVTPWMPGQQQIETRVDIAWNRFYDVEEVEWILRRLSAAYPDLITLSTIGQSVEGRDLWLATVNNPKTGTDREKPAMWIDGSVHANEIQATETALYSLWYLVSSYGQVKPLSDLVDRTAFYFMPLVNPDSRAAWFRGPTTSSMYRSGMRKTDNDSDGRLDEDGPDDLSGSGSIHVMWRRDPNGTHRRSTKNPNRMERVPADEKGEWSMAGMEGIDRDGDGRINEDGDGGYDMNRNWPTDWQPNDVQSGAGEHPFSYPETKAVGDFILAHPNIAAGQSYHNTGGMILRGPGASYRGGAYPRRDLAVYDTLGKAGAEMLPFYNYWVIHADLYTVHGGFVNWLAEGLGIVSFTNELWTDRRMLQNGQSPTAEQRLNWDERMLFGQTLVDLKEVQHPEHGPVLIGGGTKFSSRIPPPFMLEEECHRNFAFTMFHAGEMPELAVTWHEVKRLGDNLWQITLEIENKRLIPTRTGLASERKMGIPDRVLLGGEGVRVLAGGTVRTRFDRTLMAVTERPARILLEDGIGSRGRVTLRYLVEGPEKGSLLLEVLFEKARNLTLTLSLVEAKN